MISFVCEVLLAVNYFRAIMNCTVYPSIPPTQTSLLILLAIIITQDCRVFRILISQEKRPIYSVFHFHLPSKHKKIIYLFFWLCFSVCWKLLSVIFKIPLYDRNWVKLQWLKNLKKLKSENCEWEMISLILFVCSERIFEESNMPCCDERKLQSRSSVSESFRARSKLSGEQFVFFIYGK